MNGAPQSDPFANAVLETQLSFEPIGFKKLPPLDKIGFNVESQQSNTFSNPNLLNSSRVVSEYSQYSGKTKIIANRMARRPEYSSPASVNKQKSLSSKKYLRPRTMISEMM